MPPSTSESGVTQQELDDALVIAKGVMGNAGSSLAEYKLARALLALSVRTEGSKRVATSALRLAATLAKDPWHAGLDAEDFEVIREDENG